MTVDSFSADDFIPERNAQRIRIGEWIADQPTLRLERPGVVLPTEPKVMDLLFLLAAARPEVVSKERIMAALWSGVHVGDESLARCVSKLRHQLGDDVRNPRYIETIPKRGYRLIAEVGPAAQQYTQQSPRTRRSFAGWLVAAAVFAVLVWLLLQASSGSDDRSPTEEAHMRYLSEIDRRAALERERADKARNGTAATVEPQAESKSAEKKGP